MLLFIATIPAAIVVGISTNIKLKKNRQALANTNRSYYFVGSSILQYQNNSPTFFGLITAGIAGRDLFAPAQAAAGEKTGQIRGNDDCKRMAANLFLRQQGNKNEAIG